MKHITHVYEYTSPQRGKYSEAVSLTFSDFLQTLEAVGSNAFGVEESGSCKNTVSGPSSTQLMFM